MWNLNQEFTASAGKTWVEVKVPVRGTISSLSLTQIEGGNDGFTARLYNSAAARELAYEGSSESSQGAGTGLAPHQVGPDLHCLPGSTTYRETDISRPYANADGVGVDRKQRLYLLVILPDDMVGENRYVLQANLFVGRQ